MGQKRRRTRWPVPVAIAALVCLVCAVFFPIVGFDFIEFDVDEQVIENRHIRGLTGENIRHILTTPCITSYYPLRTLTFAADYQIWGMDPKGFKLTNVLIHLTNVILVFGLVRRLMRDRRPFDDSGTGWDVSLATISAGIFAVHPVVVEPVTWVGGREELLMTMGALCCFHLHFWARRLEEAAHQNRATLACRAGARVAGGAAGRTNAVGAVIPALITTWDILTLKRPKWRRIIWGTSALWVISFITFAVKKLGEVPTPGKTFGPPMLSGEWLSTVLTMPWLNLKALVWPTNLCIYYGWPRPQSFFELEVILGVTTLGLASLLLWAMRRPRQRALFGLLWFCLALLPSSHIFFVHHIARADRFLYLPLVGLAVALGVGLQPLKNARWGHALWGMTCTGVLLVLLLATRSANQIRTWQDGISVFTHALGVTENNAVAHIGLGSARFKLGQVSEALQHFRRAARIAPDHVDARYNLGSTLVELGQLPEAIHHLRWVLRINPDDAATHNNLGTALADLGQFPEALAHYRQAIRIEPDYAGAHNNLGTALADLGQFPEAIDHFRRTLAITPDYSDAHYNLGNALLNLGLFSDAVQHYRHALRIEPDDADVHNNLGNALSGLGQLSEAIGHYRQALSLNPRLWQAHTSLGALYLQQPDKRTLAVQHLRQAVAFQPDSAAAQELLSRALDD